jgi:long-chain acyl-CoA synthetase
VVEETGVEHVVTTSELDFLESKSPRPLILKGVEKARDLKTQDFILLLDRYRGKHPPEIKLSREDVAYLTYTTGTTGPPKGALNTHGNVVFNSEVYRHCWKLTPSDRILVAPFHHRMVSHIGPSLPLAPPSSCFTLILKRHSK